MVGLMLGQRGRIPVVNDSTSVFIWILLLSSLLHSFQGDSFQRTWNTHVAVTWQPRTGSCSNLPRSFHHPGPSSLAWALHSPGTGGPAREAPSTCFPLSHSQASQGQLRLLFMEVSPQKVLDGLVGRTQTTSSPRGFSHLLPSMEDPGVQCGWNTVLISRDSQPSARDRAHFILSIPRC